MKLIKYDAAHRALAEAVRVDEVKSIRDKALAMQTYAVQAKDIKLIEYATDIRMRAERKAGALLREMGERGERHKGDNKQNLRGSRVATPVVPKLSDLGVSKTQSSRWQQIAELTNEDFDDKVARAVGKAITALDSTAKKERKTGEPKKRSSRELFPSNLSGWIRDLNTRLTRAAFELSPEERAELFDYVRHVIDITERDLNSPKEGNSACHLQPQSLT